LADRLRKHNAQAEARSPKGRKANSRHNSSLRGNMMEDNRENIFGYGGYQPPPQRNNELMDKGRDSDRQRKFPN